MKDHVENEQDEAIGKCPQVIQSRGNPSRERKSQLIDQELEEAATSASLGVILQPPKCPLDTVYGH